MLLVGAPLLVLPATLLSLKLTIFPLFKVASPVALPVTVDLVIRMVAVLPFANIPLVTLLDTITFRNKTETVLAVVASTTPFPTPLIPLLPLFEMTLSLTVKLSAESDGAERISG